MSELGSFCTNTSGRSNLAEVTKGSQKPTAFYHDCKFCAHKWARFSSKDQKWRQYYTHAALYNLIQISAAATHK